MQAIFQYWKYYCPTRIFSYSIQKSGAGCSVRDIFGEAFPTNPVIPLTPWNGRPNETDILESPTASFEGMQTVLLRTVHHTAVATSLAHILESPSFRGSRRCCRFLEYCVEQVLKGAQHELKERNIGVEALQRPHDYDTNEDAIVRVTANEVRKRLVQYYQREDAHTYPIFSLPPGSYIVTFRWPDESPNPQRLSPAKGH